MNQHENWTEHPQLDADVITPTEEVTTPVSESEEEFQIPVAPAVEPPFSGFEQNIAYFGFSQMGEYHVRYEIPCQDRCHYGHDQENGRFVFAIADGVGSCQLSDCGAYAAVHAVVAYLLEKLKEFGAAPLNDGFMGALLRSAMQVAYDAVEATAQKDQQLLYSYQSTLTVTVYDGETLYFAHAGDDGIVVLTESGALELASSRHKGTEASSVYPLQSTATWQFGKVPKAVGFVMATDGVLDAFVRSPAENNRVYYPFIEPAFAASIQSKDDAQQLCQGFYDYMAGQQYRQAVTDDLTIVAVMNQKKIAACLPQFDLEEWNAQSSAYEAKIYAALYPDSRKEEPAQQPAVKTEASVDPVVPTQTGTEEEPDILLPPEPVVPLQPLEPQEQVCAETSVQSQATRPDDSQRPPKKAHRQRRRIDDQDVDRQGRREEKLDALSNILLVILIVLIIICMFISRRA